MRKLKRYLRRPKTTQERRASQDGWGRPCRNIHNLVHTWSDIWKPFRRSWKEYRRTQYKVKEYGNTGEEGCLGNSDC
jgi:hypothetical protein